MENFCLIIISLLTIFENFIYKVFYEAVNSYRTYQVQPSLPKNWRRKTNFKKYFDFNLKGSQLKAVLKKWIPGKANFGQSCKFES